MTAMKSALFGLVGLLLLGGNVMGQDNEYSEYRSRVRKAPLVSIEFDQKDITFRLYSGQEYSEATFGRKELKVKGRTVVDRNGAVVMNESGFLVNGVAAPYDLIADTRIDIEEEKTIILFESFASRPNNVDRRKAGNFINPFEPIIVESDDFIRGLLFSVSGSIDVYGEVNKDVISVFGDIYVSETAVVRGDITSIMGIIDTEKGSSVYGRSFSGGENRLRRRRFRQGDNEFSSRESIYYNRVDGLQLGIRLDYNDADSVLPHVFGGVGFAFEPERWRYELGLEQLILRGPKLALGGETYRKLHTDDEWLLSRVENSVYSVVAKEDFMDYYEVEGATLYAKARPVDDLSLRAGYVYEEATWLPAERDLWGIFGGDKKFRKNYGSLGDAAELVAEGLDGTTDAHFSVVADYDTRDRQSPYSYSAWAITGWLEWSDSTWRSDFDYRRYQLLIRRYQKINRYTMILLRGVYANSDGDLPLHKSFFLGGLGTLRGYNHKEFIGTRYWMANAEYRFDFPRTELATSISWDLGQIAYDQPLDGEVELKQSVGVSLYLGDDVRVTLAQRLDGIEKNDPQLYVRLQHRW